MTDTELALVRQYIINIMRDPDIMFCDQIRGIDTKNEVDLINVIASLYELLHREVTFESYNYMFHWANKVGSWCEDDLFTKEDFKI